VARLPLLRRNIAASLVGTAFVTVLTFIVTPIQIGILSIEAFGILGFIATLQIAFTAFDFGLSATLTRELAADDSPGKVDSSRLVDTALTVYWASALLVGVVLFALAGPIARQWFSAESLGPAVIRGSFQVVAVYLALRWPVALYTGLLAGFQRLGTINTLKVTMVSLRLVGGIAVLVVWRTLESYLVWTSISALIEVVVYDQVCRRAYPGLGRRPTIDRDAIRKVWRFSVSMNALAVLAVIIVQLDRLFVSKMLTLEMLGLYNLAYTLAAGISLVIAAVSSAVLPAMAAAFGGSNRAALTARYLDADRIMLFLVGGAAFLLVTHGRLVLTLWVNADVAGGAYAPLALLAAGFWLSGLNANVYNVAVAAGQPGQFLRVNLWIVVPYAALLYLLIGRFGLVGAAASWIALNLVYTIILVPHVHNGILGMAPTRWLAQIVVPHLAIGAFTFPGLAYAGAASGLTGQTAEVIGCLISGFAYAGLAGYWFFVRQQPGHSPQADRH